MSLLIAATALLFTPPAAEPQWYRVNSGTQTIAYVEGLGVVTDGNLRTTSTLTIRSAAMLDGALFFITKQTFNCATGEAADLSVTFLDKNGDVLRSGSPTVGTGFHPIVADTNVDFAKRFVCTRTGGTLVENPAADSAALFGK